MSAKDELLFLAFLLDLQHYLQTFSQSLQHHHNVAAAEVAHQGAVAIAKVIDTWPAAEQDAAHNLAPWEISEHPACDLKWLYEVDYLISPEVLQGLLREFLAQLLELCQPNKKAAQILQNYTATLAKLPEETKPQQEDWDPPHMPS